MIEAVLAAPVVVKVLGTLALILLVNAFCRHLAISVSVGALTLGLWSGHPVASMGAIAAERLVSVGNLMLMLIVFQVIWLSSQMAETGTMRDLVAAVRARVSREGAMAILPAVIGLLPMPGGALFSAPLVDSCDPGDNVGSRLKARANHWFRHVWEYWWPLYPGVLLAMEILEFEVWQMMVMGVPLTVAAIVAGYVFLLRPVAKAHRESGARTGESPELLPRLLPIIVVVAAYALVRMGHAGLVSVGVTLPPMNRYLPMVVGLTCAMGVLQWQRSLNGQKWGEIVFSMRTLNLAVIVAAVRVYGAFIEADLPSGTPLVAQMRTELSDWGIPLLAVIMILPLISGLATGLSIGFVGASFPIVMRLLGADPEFGRVLATGVLAYGFGYMGMLLSPVHVCLIVTCEHFTVRVGRAMLGMLPPASIILGCSVLLYALWSWIL